MPLCTKPLPFQGSFSPFFLKEQVASGSCRQCYGTWSPWIKEGKCIIKWNQMSLQLCAGQPFCKWHPPVRQGCYTDVEKDHTLAKMDLEVQCWRAFTQWFNGIAVVAAVILSVQQSLASSAETSSPHTPLSRLRRQQTIKSFRSHMQIQGPGLEGLLQILASDSLCWMDSMLSSWQKCYQWDAADEGNWKR